MNQRRRVRFDAQRCANVLVIALVIVVVVWEVNPTLLFSGTTITGGDTGSHIVTAAYLRQTWGSGALTSWDPGWFNGFPLYTYYFVLPDALAVAASYVISFAVAFKLTTILGSLLLPAAAYAMAKLFNAPNPIPAACAGATLPFLFDASYQIDGGNLFSTFAGEYAFSLSLSLALVTIGLFARGIRTGRGRWLSAVMLSLTLAAHLLPWLFAIGIVVLLLAMELLAHWGYFDRDKWLLEHLHRRRAIWFVASTGLLSAGLSAWWLLPFATSQQYTTNMGYQNDPVSTFGDIFSKLGWLGTSAGDRWVIIAAVIALFMAFYWRDRLGITLTLSAVVAFCAFVLDPQGSIWNERLVPFWFISIYLSAGWVVGAALYRLVNVITNAMVLRSPEDELDDGYVRSLRRGWAVFATYVVALLTLLSTVPGLVPWMSTAAGLTPGANQVINWAQHNYSGYQAQPGWTEFEGIIATLDQLSKKYGCGRAMWQYSLDEERFGTPEALMTLPLWTNNCIGSEEGLLFESSATTPYHFLNQAELSDSPSDPVVGLNYGGVNVALGIQHLQMLGVKYFFAYSPDIVAAAKLDPSLEQVAVTQRWSDSGDQWHFYFIRSSPLVQPVAALPNVVANIDGQHAWLAANQDWWLDPNKWSVLYASNGPANWPRINSTAFVIRHDLTATTTVSKIVMNEQSISFNVSRLNVPVIVKISYYPRWRATGATGPYRVSPNLMVVVPTSHHVQLVYGETPAVSWGNVVTDVTVLFLLLALWRARPWRRPRRANPAPAQ